SARRAQRSAIDCHLVGIRPGHSRSRSCRVGGCCPWWHGTDRQGQPRSRGQRSRRGHTPRRSKMKRIALALVFLSLPALAAEPVPRMLVEIYHIAPGQHTAFLEAIAKYDQANRMAGLPPRQLYVHSDGASWDFM